MSLIERNSRYAKWPISGGLTDFQVNAIFPSLLCALNGSLEWMQVRYFLHECMRCDVKDIKS